ncbi:sucrase ferredoxin [Phormidium sp. FACHB-592]|uniref:Sucrase ferredoxin n=1 Tax=Stenomitos frigidus AS-A4 TaxID=2933935 RepID=A0ABV0KHF7_9CYAN|nr:sucrase ferredoxin [Phormidium sp. FACHB-592]MBD2073532.1 sucrase ferredoxin [Phormidium sp. FACHB-592]
MVEPFFCAEESNTAGEDLIGCAVMAQFYVLVECPPPWSANAFHSNQIPDNLRTLVQALKQDKRTIRPLLIHRDRRQEPCTSVIILRQQDGVSFGYSKQEFQVSSLKEVAPLVSDYFNECHTHEPIGTDTRDILVCTHGSHDKCCAKYGQSFYRQAIATVAQLALNPDVRVWQASHIGGHRFAPTAIDFPEGRYYGRLDQDSFTAILTRSGNTQCFNHVYRGWGILPWAAQVLERALLLKYGWDWFKYGIVGRVIDHNEDESWNRVEITLVRADHTSEVYQADVVIDDNKKLHLRGSCGNTESYAVPQYAVKYLTKLAASAIP